MSVGLRFTNGTLTVNLSDLTRGIFVEHRPGNEPSGAESELDVYIVRLTGNRALNIETTHYLNTLFEQARERKNKPFLERVFIERDLGDGVWWRSEVLEGQILLTDTLDRLGRSPQIEIAVSRANFWEGAEAQIPLSNGNGTNNTSGLTVYPIDDGQSGKDNWVDISGASVAGDLEAPIRFELTNTYNNSNRTETVFLSLNRNSSPSTFAHILEGENSNAGGSILPGSPDYASYSNGRYRELPVFTNQNMFQMYWELNGDFLGKAAGNDFHVLARLASVPESNTWAKVFLSIEGLTTIYESTPALLASGARVQELGTMRIPPYLWKVGETIAPLRLYITFWRTGGGYNQAIDYLQLCPLDSWRKITHVGYYIGYLARLVDNQIEDMAYVMWGAGAYGYQVIYGDKIYLKPGANQRLYIVASGSAMPVRTSSVKIWYRPRRRTL